MTSQHIIFSDTTQKIPSECFWGFPNESYIEKLYRRMFFIRCFEERVLLLFEQGELNGTTHACIGQEANCVGIMTHLTPHDHIFSNHRCHGHYLARTGDAIGLLAELMGKKSGICGGMGGSQHICSNNFNFKSNGVQGGIVPAAAGIALAEKLKASGNLSIVFIGDGTLGQGIVYETLNIASLWNIPLLIVLENNKWAQSTPLQLHLAGDIKARFTAFNIQTYEINSTDVLAIEHHAAECIHIVRNECRPLVLIIDTIRLCSHSKSDDCRPQDEIEHYKNNDPLIVHGQRISEDQKNNIKKNVYATIDTIVTLVRNMP